MTPEKTYHVGTASGVPAGPFGTATIEEKIYSGEISGQTLIWCKGMADWAPCASLSEFQPALAAAATGTPPPMPSGTNVPPMPAAPLVDAYSTGVGAAVPAMAEYSAPACACSASIWNPVSAMIYNLKHYVNLDGRASRDEYWNYILANYIVMALLALIPYVGVVLAFLILPMGLLLPSLSCAVRRLHDAGHPWTYLLFGFIPVAGPIILLVFLLQPSQPANEFGERAVPPMSVPAIQNCSFFNKRAWFCSVGLAIVALCFILKMVFFIIGLKHTIESGRYHLRSSYPSHYSDYSDYSDDSDYTDYSDFGSERHSFY